MRSTGDEITSYSLPGILGEIARVTTVEIAVAIIRVYGGTRLSIPTEARMKRNHPLCRAVGVPAARIIAAHWGGNRYDVPSAKPFLNWHDARRLRSEGKSYTEIAQELGLGRRHVQKLLHGFTAPGAAGAHRDNDDAPKICPACGHRHRGKASARACDERQLTLELS
jgi:hypothetical protein